MSLTEEEAWMGRALGAAEAAMQGAGGGAVAGAAEELGRLGLPDADPPPAESPLQPPSPALSSPPPGQGERLGCVAVARGLGKAEAAATLSHELMHGLFYSYRALRRRCRCFWEDEAGEEERAAWMAFLRVAGYDPDAPDLAANELLAYMTTESEIFAERNSSSREKGPRAARQALGEEATRNAVLRGLQARFNRAVGPLVPRPLPALRDSPIPLQLHSPEKE